MKLPTRSRLRYALTSLKREIRVYRAVSRDPRTPIHARLLLGLAVAYLASPFDLIPDFIPVIGHLDDAIIVPTLFLLAIRAVPATVIEDARRNTDAPAAD